MLMEKIVLPFKMCIAERRRHRHHQRHSATALHLSLDIDPKPNAVVLLVLTLEMLSGQYVTLNNAYRTNRKSALCSNVLNATVFQSDSSRLAREIHHRFLV